MQEIWKDVEGYEGSYQVSNLGRIKSFKNEKERILILHPCKGYIGIILSNNGIRKNYLVHRLIALVFVPNPENKPQVNHINGIKTDNRVENLEWVTCKENNEHAYRIGLNKDVDRRGISHPMSKLTNKQVLEIRSRENYGRGFYAELGREFNITADNISFIYNRKTWQHI